jgi:L-asparaginase II
VAQAGEQETFFYPRSALKFFQILPLLESGAADHYGFTPAELAVICASHNAEPFHIEAVRSILKKADIDERYLGCGPHEPVHEASKRELWKEEKQPTDIHNNCSGKHAGFLALAKFMGAPLESYLAPHHPVQVLVRQAISELYGIEEKDMVNGVDGCSAPNYGMNLRHLATGFMRYGDRSLGPDRRMAMDRIILALTQHPEMVAGTDRYCTHLMKNLGDDVIGKVGAAGVYAVSLYRKGYGIAVKIEDGASGEQYAVAQEILAQSGLFHKEELQPLNQYRREAILNSNGIHVGKKTVCSDIISEQWLLNCEKADWQSDTEGVKA